MPASPATPASRPAAQVNPNVVLALVAVAQFMIVLDATIVNVALPTIQGDLGFSQQNLLWVLNAYTLVFGGFLLLGGRLADRLGRRRLFMAGTALFAGASLVCGVAQSEATLLAARGAPGTGWRHGLARGAVDHPDHASPRARNATAHWRCGAPSPEPEVRSACSSEA